MSNIIFAFSGSLVIGIHYGGRVGPLPSPILYLNIILFLICSFWFLRETKERGQARYFRPALGADDVWAMLYAIAVIAAYAKGYIPKTATGLKLIAITNPTAAVLSYFAWAWALQSGRERDRIEWEENFKKKHRIKV